MLDEIEFARRVDRWHKAIAADGRYTTSICNDVDLSDRQCEMAQAELSRRVDHEVVVTNTDHPLTLGQTKAFRFGASVMSFGTSP